jgi:ATP-dependent helicase HrpA
MKKSEQPLLTTLSNFIYERFGVDIPCSEWPLAEISDHLKMRISVVDHNGYELASGRDAGILTKGKKGQEERKYNLDGWNAAREKWERTDITSWDFDDLPFDIDIDEHVRAYPALEPADGCVNVKIFNDMNEAVNSHKLGVKLLFSLQLKKEIKFMKRVTRLPEELSEKFVYFGDLKQYEKEMISGFLDRLFKRDIRTRESFLREAEMIKRSIISDISEFIMLIGGVLREYSLLREKMYKLESANKGIPAVLDFISQIRNELGILIPREFHEIYPEERISQLPRYLKALSIRVERGINDIFRDRGKASQVKVFTTLFKKMKNELSSNTSMEKLTALNELRWMIEEYKVSLFAQELKTAFPVSHKRIMARVKEVERMI